MLIPTDQKKGFFPAKPDERVRFLEGGLKERALGLGYKTVIPDLILESVPPHLARSVTAFQLYRERNPNDVLLAGVGNVVELYDADSVGMNALLAGIAKELSINLLLTTEVSAKARGGSVRELRRAVDMNLFDTPKDLGFDLLILKEKRRTDWRFRRAEEVVEAREKQVELEPVYFRVWLEDGRIWVNAHRGTEVVLTVVGGRAERGNRYHPRALPPHLPPEARLLPRQGARASLHRVEAGQGATSRRSSSSRISTSRIATFNSRGGQLPMMPMLRGVFVPHVTPFDGKGGGRLGGPERSGSHL